MSTYHTINLPDVTDHNAVLRFFGEIRNPGADNLRVWDGADYFIVSYPAKKRVKDEDKVSEEETQRRLAALEGIKALAREISAQWNTDKTAPEIIAENRREFL